tara:strand:- start:17917 stop:19080 length:1164 start_codon:yes stop_codon:yes gene_type:complete
MNKLSLLGASGSIGDSTLQLVRSSPEIFNIVGMTGNKNVEKMAELITEFNPSIVAMSDRSSARELNSRFKIDVLSGEEGLNEVAAFHDADTVVAGIVGYAGLPSILAAIKSNKRLLLANKEALVCAAPILVSELKRSKAEILPIDSEHNAIFQCLGENYRCFTRPKNLRRIILTASGGPFRNTSLEKMESASVEEAIAHPKWKMGKKISVDSATMMNKGLEMIEAFWLFNLKPTEIEVVIHPESIVHSMVEFRDRSTLAQLSNPDMRVPISSALLWPKRIDTNCSPLDWTKQSKLSFENVDLQKFQSIEITKMILNEGPTASCILNSANEVAVHAFLTDKIVFGEITKVIDQILSKFSTQFSAKINSVAELNQLNMKISEFGKTLHR